MCAKGWRVGSRCAPRRSANLKPFAFVAGALAFAWRTSRPLDLVAIAVVTVLAAAAAFFGFPAWLRVPLGLLFMLAAPGYAFIAALFPERYREATADEARQGLQPLERIALGLGLSIAIVPLLGLGLNFTPWGIRLVPVVVAVAVFTLVCTALAWGRRSGLPADRRFELALVSDAAPWGERGTTDKVLTVLLVAAIVFAAGALAYVLVKPRAADPFTEMYVLGPTGKAACYPAAYGAGEFRVSIDEVRVACPLTVSNLTLGIVNHEGAPLTYTLRTVWTQEHRNADNSTTLLQSRLVSDQSVRLESVPVDTSLGASFKPEYEAPFTLPAPPFNGTVRLTFLLFKGPAPAFGAADPTPEAYRSLHLWIDVA